MIGQNSSRASVVLAVDPSWSTPKEGPALITPYDATTPYTVPPGENLARFHEDGSVTIDRKEPEERPKKAKPAHAKAIREAEDDTIQRFAETPLAVYYRIGLKISVTERTSGGWLCGTCNGSDRWELGDHEGCCHIQRVKGWVLDHPSSEKVV